MKAKYMVGQLVGIRGFENTAIRVTTVVIIQTENATAIKYVGRLWHWWERDGKHQTGTDSNKMAEMFECELGEVLNF